MTERIRAVYEQGHLRLLDAVQLNEGQEVAIQIISVPKSEILDLLGERVVLLDNIETTDESDEALWHQIEEGWHGDVPLSQTIIEERQIGP